MTSDKIRLAVLSSIVVLQTIGCSYSRGILGDDLKGASPSLLVKPVYPLEPQTTPKVMVNAEAYSGLPNGLKVTYTYGPSIIYTQGAYHMYFCSNGSGGNNLNWDNVRHESSPDLIHWSAPDNVLVPTVYERSNCDPSIVFSGGFYYLYYGGNVTTDQTVVFVARSSNPDGPFLKYTPQNTWESQPAVTQIIIPPANPDPTGTYYGAGEPSVVLHDGGFYMWYSDDTYTGSKPEMWQTYLVTSPDGVNWTPATLTTGIPVGVDSIDVKYDPAIARFVMVEITNNFTCTANVAFQYSVDGTHWSDQVAVDENIPPNAANPGLSGDEQGNIMNGATVVGYGASYPGQTVDTWGEWDLWGNEFARTNPK
jgi:hypothetical protein